MEPSDLLLYTTRLDCPPDELAARERLLSPDERQRADRLKVPGARLRFIAARGWLRQILAAACGRPPQTLSFTYNPHGKPALADDPHLRFNLSHSGDLAVVALAADRELGVDVEELRPAPRLESLARRYFAAEEIEALFALPEEHRLHAFFTCWTRKEAYLKARGEGFRIPLRSFAVSLDDRPRLRRAEDARRWQFHPLEPAEGFIGCVAVETLPHSRE